MSPKAYTIAAALVRERARRDRERSDEQGGRPDDVQQEEDERSPAPREASPETGHRARERPHPKKAFPEKKRGRPARSLRMLGGVLVERGLACGAAEVVRLASVHRAPCGALRVHHHATDRVLLHRSPP